MGRDVPAEERGGGEEGVGMGHYRTRDCSDEQAICVEVT